MFKFKARIGSILEKLTVNNLGLEKECVFGVVGVNILDIERIIELMDKEDLYMLMEIFIKVSLLMIKLMDLGSI